MHWLIRVFNKVFVLRFYQAHFLAFVFVVLAMFGMADGNTVLRLHYAILSIAFSSPPTLFCLWAVWLLYSINGLRYMLSTLGKEGFHFLFTANSARPVKLLSALGQSVLLINIPVVIYGGIGIVIAVKQAYYFNALLGALGLLLNLVVTVLIIYYRLVNVHRAPVINARNILPTIRFKPGILSIMLRQITYDNKVAVIATKLFSCGVIYAAHYEWGSFNYDIRWMQVAMALSIPAQGILLYQVWTFETAYLSFTRNFPTPVLNRYLNVLALVLILLMPEMVLLASYCVRFHILWQLPIFLLYAVMLPVLLYAMLFTRGFNQDSFNTFLFAMCLGTFFVSLFGFTWLLALIFLPVSFLVYKEAYYDFERAVE